MIALALALTLAQNEPALEATARNSAGSFICEGTTDLPDEARLLVSVGYVHGDRTALLAAETILTKEGKFRVEFPVYRQTPLPGRYVLTVQFAALSQRKPIERDNTQREVPVDVPGDVVGAKRGFFAELRAAMEALDPLLKELPADWRDKAFVDILALIARPESNALGVLTPLEDTHSALFDCLNTMSGVPEEQRAPLRDEFNHIRAGFLKRLDELLSDPRRSFDLLKQIEAALKEGKPADALVLELGGHIGDAHRTAVATLASQIAEGKTQEALETIEALRRTLTPPDQP